MRGKIIKSIAGFYEVHTGDTVYRCRAKGLFRALKQKPLVGDDVEIDITDTVSVPPEGNVIRLYPRTNALIRPLHAVICFNKKDLASPEEIRELQETYEACGCQVLFISNVTGESIDQVREVLAHKTTVITGPSGAGKSTLINLLCPHANMETGEISRKISRGKNTTRHVELLASGEDTFLVDTPGFTSLYLQDLQAEDLKDYYPEFRARSAPSATAITANCSRNSRTSGLYIKRKDNEAGMKLGIVGLPNVGKSTLFNSLTKAGAEAANYPFCTIDPNVGIVPVPDERIQLLGKMYNSKKITPAVIEFVDIAGLVKGASKGEGLGNQFLANIREVDAIVHVVRCFEDPNVIHVDGSIDPLRDIETINLELIFSDLEVLERRISKVTRTAKADKEAAKELVLLKKLKEHLENGEMASSMELEDDTQKKWMKEFNLLTDKPVIYAANVSEDELADDAAGNEGVQKVREYAARTGSEVFVICASIEAEISELDDDEKQMFLEDLGLTESGLEKLVRASYHTLGLMSFLTAGEDETRAWTIKIGTKAPQAAGKIHSDFERGFIKAEVVNYKVLLEEGSLSAAREKGLVGMEGVTATSSSSGSMSDRVSSILIEEY